jgi:hypothetical protein
VQDATTPFVIWLTQVVVDPESVSLKVTLPVGIVPSGLVAVTVAFNAVLWFTAGAAGVTVRVVTEVVLNPIVCGKVAVLALKLASPL